MVKNDLQGIILDDIKQQINTKPFYFTVFNTIHEMNYFIHFVTIPDILYRSVALKTFDLVKKFSK